jgi:hypothetical protein
MTVFWIPPATATDADAIHDNVANEISAITEKTVPADADLVIIEDSAASYVKKKVQISNLPGGTGGGGVGEGRLSGGGTTAVLIPGVNPTSFGSEAVTTGLIRYSPLVVNEDLTIASLKTEVVGGNGAGRLARIGLYEADGDWQPTNLVGEGEIDCSALGIKTVTLATTLTAGRYLSAITTNNSSPTYRQARAQPQGNMLLGANDFIRSLQVSASYAALPDPGTVWDTVSTSTTLATAHYVFLAL